MFNLLLSSTFDFLSDNSLYLVGGAILLFAIAVFVLALVDKNLAKRYSKVMAVCLLGVMLLYGVFLLIFGIIDEFNSQSLIDNGLSTDVIYYVFLPILITILTSLALCIFNIIVTSKKPRLAKKLWSIFSLVLFALIAVTLILIYIYYSKNTSDWYKYNSVALWVGSMLLVAGVIIASLFFDKAGNLQFDTKCLTIAGICISLSFVLSYVKLFDPPTGGSVTLASLLPVMLFAYVYGMKKGLLIGFIYGILQAVQEPWIVHPAQFLLDYPIAFSMVGLAGVLSRFNILKKLPQLKFSIGAIIAVFFRFISSVIAGIFAWEASFALSLTINSVILLDVILVIVVGVMLFSSKSFRKELDRLNPKLDLQ